MPTMTLEPERAQNGTAERALDGPEQPEANSYKITDAIPAIAWCARPDGSTEFLNRRWQDYTGLPPEEGVGWKWKAAIHPSDLGKLMAEWETLLANGEPGECEARLRRSDGVYRWFLFRVEPLRDENRRVVRWYGTGTDIEDRKRGDSLRTIEKHTFEMIADGASLNDILNELCRSIDVQTSAAFSTVLLMDAEGKQLWHAAGPLVPRTWLPAISPRPIGPHEGCCGAAAYFKRRVIVADVSTDPVWPDDYRDFAIQNGIRAAWSEPILTKDGQVLGTFALYSPEPRMPTNAEIELIEGAGRIALVAIGRQRSQEALRKSEAELRRITDLIPQAIIVLNPDGRAIYANRVALEYTGLSLDEMRAADFRERIFHPADIQRLREERGKALLSNVPFENEQRARGKDGNYRWFLIRYNPFLDESGKVIRWYATGTDIEDRKRAEEKLRHEGRELRQLIDSLPQHVLVLDANGFLVQANQVMLDYGGRTLEEMRGAGTSERIKRDLHPDDLQRVRAERDRGLSMGAPVEMEKRLLGKDGRYRWFLFRYNPLRAVDGQIERWFATATDIEDRKQAEDRIRNETVALREEIVRSSMFEEIVGSSDKLRKVLDQVARVAPTDSTVLIQGETGTGKELIARAIHNRSKRANRAFIRVNCAAIPTSLIASELFGHEKGSFTGALQRRAGRFESAEGGTIFLDEIGELLPETQVALLRVLQEREFERVGGNRSIPVDVRVLAATNRDLSAAVAKGMFRKDLFYRLNVFPIQLPPLRDRVDDIPLLMEYLVARYGEKAGKRIRRLSKDTLNLFQSYDWPGNVRELQNVIERAVILCDEETFFVDPSWLTPAAAPRSAGASVPLVADLAEREKAMIENALREAQGLVSGPTGAAAKLGVARQTLESKIRKLGINRHQFKSS